MSRKPIIGITTYQITGDEGFGGQLRGLPGQGFSALGCDYMDAVIKVGGVPIGIPTGHLADCKHIIEAVDGLILAGGEDIDPTCYGEHPDMRSWALKPERDRYELQLLEEALSIGKPTLAICRGLQLLNILYQGTLYKDMSDIPGNVLAHQFSRAPRWYLAHRVSLKEPVLQRLYQATEIWTNTYHHQAIKEIGTGLQISAIAEDGVIEGLYHPDHPNLLAIQWHPEMMQVQLEEGLLPFQWLMDCIADEHVKEVTTRE